jgi:hypothetical protein
MRRLAVTLAFAVLSLGFAPAPFPKADRAAARERLRRYDGIRLAVAWGLWLLPVDSIPLFAGVSAAA